MIKNTLLQGVARTVSDRPALPCSYVQLTLFYCQYLTCRYRTPCLTVTLSRVVTFQPV